MFQLVCDPSGAVVEVTLKELVPAVVRWGGKLDQISRVLLAHILASAQVCLLINIGNFLFSINAMYPYNLLPFSAVSTYFGGWRYNRLSSSCFRRTRALEHWCPPSNVDWVATIYSSESYRDLSLCISWSNKLYTRKLLFSILLKTIFNVSSPFWSYLLTIFYIRIMQ